MRNPSPAELHALADAAGKAAAAAVNPVPMVVGDADLAGNFVPGGKKYFVSEGACGFGWITIHPARGAFVNYLKKNKIGSKNYGGGYYVPARPAGFTQSIARNEAYAYAYAKVLNEAGIKAYGHSRLD